MKPQGRKKPNNSPRAANEELTRRIREFESRERECRKTERALRESEERYRRLSESTMEGIVIHENGMILDANPAFATLVGYELADVIGKEAAAFAAPESRDVVRKHILEGYDKPYEVLGQRKDGSTFPVELFGKSIPFEGRSVRVTAIHDVTGRKQVEKQLELQKSYFQQLFENSPAGIVVLNTDDIVLNANKAFEHMFQYAIDEMRGSKLNSFIVPESLVDEAQEYSALAQNRNIVQRESVRQKKDGSPINVSITGYPIIIDNELVGIYGMYVDITERKILETNLRQAQKMESLGTLAGGIAHDFNNILAIIMANASLVRKHVNDAEKIPKIMEAIGKATQRGAALVRQLLTFARKTEILLESVQVNEIVPEMAKLIDETFAKTVTIAVHLDEKLPSIIGDANQIHQVLLNLCVNARDAMPSGGTLSLNTTLVRRGALRLQFPKANAHEYVCVKITDTGIGMDEATRNRIFEPFFTTKERGRGTGLGLAVVFGIMESHHAFIDVETELGKGTTFYLYFPVHTRELARTAPDEEREKEVRGGTETLLLVEDEELIRETIAAVLGDKGYTVLTAVDGSEAIQMYKQRATDIALVLSDIGLPKIGGVEVFSTLKELNPNVKVILASGYLEPKTKTELVKAGAKAFLQKPYEETELFGKIREILDE
ncbi:MAG: PAS domain S-box protein [Bacteroidota bacterium]